MRRRDNIQAEFETKNEALLSRKGDQEAVSVLLPAAHVFVCLPVLFSESRCNKVKCGVGPLPQGHPHLISRWGASQED